MNQKSEVREALLAVKKELDMFDYEIREDEYGVALFRRGKDNDQHSYISWMEWKRGEAWAVRRPQGEEEYYGTLFGAVKAHTGEDTSVRLSFEKTFL